MPRLGVIELSQLPAFDVLETISTEDIISERMAELVQFWAQNDPPNAAQYDVGNLEFDPIRINQECCAYFELMLRDRVNQAARAVSLADATGDNIDHIASRYPGGMPRMTPTNTPGLTVAESDSAYKTRIWLSPNTFTQNGVYENYVFFVLTAEQAANTPLRDCQATSTPGDPDIYIYLLADGSPVTAMTDDNGNYTGEFSAFPNPIPTEDQIVAALDYLEAPGMGRMGLTDVLHALPPGVVNATYDIQIELFPGWDEVMTMSQLYPALASLIESQRYLGYSHTRSAIDGALKVSGVSSVNVLSPQPPQGSLDPDILVPAAINEIVFITSVSLTFAGRAGTGPLPPTS